MKSEELKTDEDPQKDIALSPTALSTHIVTADSVQAEEVPTIPIGSLETISTLQPEVTVHAVNTTRTVSIPTPLVVQPEEYRRSLGEWLQIWRDGMRTAYLPLPLMPVLLGSALAWTQTVTTKTPLGQFHFTHFFAAIIAVFLLQWGANLVNDYYDYMRGIDTSNALGPGGLIQQGMLKPARILLYGFSLLGLGTVIGMIVALRGGALVYLFGLIAILGAYFYSAAIFPLSSYILGEVTGFFVFGPIITIGAYMIQSGGRLSSQALLYSLPLGLLAVAVLHVNNMRDMEGDTNAGKRTLANTIGMGWSRAAYMVLVLLAYLIIIGVGAPHNAPHTILIALWTLPILVIAITGIIRSHAPASFHQIIHQTLTLTTYFTIFLTIGLIVWAIIPVLPHIPAHLLPF